MIIWTYANEKEHWTFSDLKNAKNEKIYLDLSNFAELKYFYAQALTDLKRKILSVMNLLENEIE